MTLYTFRQVIDELQIEKITEDESQSGPTEKLIAGCPKNSSMMLIAC